MNFKAQHISYGQTKSFSKIVLDYLNNATPLRPFYNYPASIDGLKKTIEERKAYPTNRSVLVEQLKNQYRSLQTSDAVKANITALLSENTFTICTAHQPNIFTGHLYFIYKILHAIKLADELKAQIAGCNFVPVYYMGSEDADLEELGEVYINGKKYTWKTEQKGAVGRMKIDKAFIALIDEIEGQLGVEKFGAEILLSVRKAYTINKTIEQATFEFVNELFGEYGLVILLPDNTVLKNEFSGVIKKELTEQFSSKAVAETIAQFPAEYKVQAAGRELNMFYLKDDSRERIEKGNSEWAVFNTTTSFKKDQLFEELKNYPERFSPNVILRPVFQEMILPNIAFIGGGGELAYWLELKKVFEAVQVPYPVLILRNSFTIIPKKIGDKIAALKLDAVDFFEKESDLINALVKRQSTLKLEVEEEKSGLQELYARIQSAANLVDITLQAHVSALQTQALMRIELLEKKMLKAERIKFEAQQRQITKIRIALFPGNGLQERVDNILPYYSIFGKELIGMLYKNSRGLQQDFCIVTED
ncbi:MAG: bacillithiol biosynthesis cysteine-adding enzyme BshC [Ferruginibacter sp.]